VLWRFVVFVLFGLVAEACRRKTVSHNTGIVNLVLLVLLVLRVLRVLTGLRLVYLTLVTVL